MYWTAISQKDCQCRKQTSSTAPDEYFNTRRKALFASPLEDCLTAQSQYCSADVASISFINKVNTLCFQAYNGIYLFLDSNHMPFKLQLQFQKAMPSSTEALGGAPRHFVQAFFPSKAFDLYMNVGEIKMVDDEILLQNSWVDYNDKFSVLICQSSPLNKLT